MNFTRDPIIETVITPREGCKLVVRSSKGASQEDYYVDALEVVSFGHSFFFRSLERPKSFLVPVSDYEIFEDKEPKLALKNASADRSIKIGGGREMAPPRVSREAPALETRDDDQQIPSTPVSSDRKSRDKQRRRTRRGRDRNEPYAPQAVDGGEMVAPKGDEGGEVFGEKSNVEVAPVVKQSFISKLFPPPTTLIKETIGRYKTIDPAVEELFPMSPRENASLEEHTVLEEGNHHPSSSEDSIEEE